VSYFKGRHFEGEIVLWRCVGTAGMGSAAEIFEHMMGERGVSVDQGSEFISRDLDLWGYQKGVILDFSRPGKPTDNSFIESFNGKFRAECLNTHWFMSLDDARTKMEDWRRDYNEVRPHSAIGNKPPISLQNGSPAAPPG